MKSVKVPKATKSSAKRCRAAAKSTARTCSASSAPGLDGREIVGGGGRERHGNPRWQARFVVACYPEAGRGERWRRECQSTPIDVQRVFRGGGWKSSGLATRPCARRDVPTTDSLRKLSKGCVAAKSLDGPISDASPWSNYRFTRASR